MEAEVQKKLKGKNCQIVVIFIEKFSSLLYFNNKRWDVRGKKKKKVSRPFGSNDTLRVWWAKKFEDVIICNMCDKIEEKIKSVIFLCWFLSD